MSVGYRAVQWSPGKRRYDLALATLLTLYLATFFAVTVRWRPEMTVETALIRAFGTAAFLLLHVVLAIGPLARLDRRFLPLLWNRRHLGVTMFLCGLAHGALSLIQFHAFGVESPLVSLFVSSSRYGSLAQFPFQPLGFAALVVLFLMAATSHDFWLAQLTAPVWKALHTGVYLAYALLVAHVALGALQDERSPLLVGALALGVVAIVVLHLAAAVRERRIDRRKAATGAGDLVEIGRVEEIPEGRAKVAFLGGERVAVFRYDGKVSAVSNVCQHQNGPLGEGKILDGCITCPWHGFQYHPADGRSPAPFTERVPTFRVEVIAGRVLVDPRPLPAGTRVEPARIDAGATAPPDDEAFFVGYRPVPDEARSVLRRSVAALALGAVAVAATVASQQRPLGEGQYEFGVESELVGWLRLAPMPALWRTTDHAQDGGGPTEPALGPLEVVPLVGIGKHRPAEAVRALSGRMVRARGSWIRRGSERLFEIASAEALPGSDGAVEAEVRSLGRFRLRGEIVDAKCFLGVMKPGEGKGHRACAALCIAGGSPAAFVSRTDAGSTAVLWLVAPDGRALGRELADVVAEPVEIEGELARLGDRTLLIADRGSIRRL